MTAAPALLEVRDLRKAFAARRSLRDWATGKPGRIVNAVNDVSFSIAPGETLGLVGESGCGKSTLGRCVAGLIEPTAGDVIIEGERLTAATDRRHLARRVQIVFQDPYSSLNPRLSIGAAIGEALKVHRLARSKGEVADRTDELLLKVGLTPKLKGRLPHSFSGGQRQRISIARALAVQPAMIVADEPVSALDVSIRAQVINLLQQLQDELGLAYLFIAHDLNLVRQISRRVAVMYLGQIVEIGDAEAVFAEPQHPYTRALLSAVPQPDPARRMDVISLEGEPPSPHDLPSGCYFKPRCPIAIADCGKAMPRLRDVRPGVSVRCIRAWLRSNGV